MRISVCIATFRRPQRLRLVLEDLAAQTLLPAQVVVVDNDVAESARPAIEAYRQLAPPYELVYDTQPERGIAITRNRTVALADGDWLAFLDDDERAPTDWLARLAAAIEADQLDGVLAPVIPQVPAEAPAWIRRGSFYDFPRMATGSVIPANQLRFGNVMLRADPVRALPGPFDESYGLMTGEDADLLLRLIERGARIRWNDEAVVYEPVEAARLSFRWLAQRAYSGGQEYARKLLAGRYGPVNVRRRMLLFVDALGKALLSLLLSVLLLPVGRHRAAQWYLRAKANHGKLSAFTGERYQEYEKASVSKTG